MVATTSAHGATAGPTPSASQTSLISITSKRNSSDGSQASNNASSSVSHLDTQSTLATELSTPTSPTRPTDSKQSNSDTAISSKVPLDRQRTPDPKSQNGHEQSSQAAHSSTPHSPASVTTPEHNSLKRYANGSFKPPALSPPLENRARAHSFGSSRTEELKAQLSYAMVKVQNGWEHHNIAKVEQLAAQSLSPKAASASPLRSSRSLAHIRGHSKPGQVFSGGIRKPNGHRRPSHLHSLRPMMSNGSLSLSPQRGRFEESEPYLDIDSARRAFPSNRANPSSQRTPSRRDALPTTPEPRLSPSRSQQAIARDEQDAMDALLLMGSPGAGRSFERASVDSALEGQTYSHAKKQAMESSDRMQQAPRQALRYLPNGHDEHGSSTDGRHSQQIGSIKAAM